MAKIRLDKQTMKENELDHILIRIKDQIIENPKLFLIPVIVVIVVVIGSYAIKSFISNQNQTAEMQMMQAQKDFRDAVNSTDKSTQLIGLNKASIAFKKIANDFTWTQHGKIAKLYYADCIYHNEKYDDAIKAYQQALSSGLPRVSAAWAQMSLGYCFLNKNDYASSIKEFEVLITQYPESFLVPSAKIQAAGCYEKLNNSAKAKELYQSIIKTYPDSSWTREAEARLNAISGLSDKSG